MPFRIPVYEPSIGELERRYVNECLDSGWISSRGVFVDRFEKNFSKFVGTDYCVSVSNGTTALHTALLALGIGPGDEVIVPTLTYIASINAIAYVGAKPVLVDCNPHTWQADPADIRRVLSPNSRAIMAVHLYGQPSDMINITRIATEHDLLVIEDCAEALGSYISGKHVGNFGDIATYSFYGNKTITTGEGGMVSTNNPNLAERSAHLKGQGLARHREYWHDIVGYNYRMTNICAAIGCAQLEKVESTLARKAEIAERYRSNLGDLVTFQACAEDTTTSNWMVCFCVEHPSLRESLRNHLSENGVETRPVFYPMHTMPMYSHYYRRMPNSDLISTTGINLPSHPTLLDSNVDDICDLIRGFMKIA